MTCHQVQRVGVVHVHCFAILYRRSANALRRKPEKGSTKDYQSLLYMYLHTFVCMYVCMYARMYVFFVFICLQCKYVCIHEFSIAACMYVCMHAYMTVCMYVCVQHG